jgi:hypothetical protein
MTPNSRDDAKCWYASKEGVKPKCSEFCLRTCAMFGTEQSQVPIKAFEHKSAPFDNSFFASVGSRDLKILITRHKGIVGNVSTFLVGDITWLSSLARRSQGCRLVARSDCFLPLNGDETRLFLVRGIPMVLRFDCRTFSAKQQKL